MNLDLAEPRTVVLPHRPRGDQEKVYRLASRFSVFAIGRQYGKSTMLQLRMAMRAMQLRGRYIWVAPVFAQARMQMERFLSNYRGFVTKANKSAFEATLIGGSEILFRGSDNPDSMRGDTIHGASLDECGTMRSDVWPEIIRPMLGTTEGWADFGGTPKGPNWFHHLWLRAAEGGQWGRHHAPSNASPFFSNDEFETARRELPERVFRQEYLAEFLSDDSEVFRGINDCIGGELTGPERGINYVFGVDVAKHQDWTVLVGIDLFRSRVVYFERFQKIDWPFQIQRITDAATSYNNAMVHLDATGVGDPIFDALLKNGVSVVPVKFTTEVKSDLVQRLSLAIEKRRITFPEIPELLNELRMFAFERLPSGVIRYSSPQGYHDDCVMALALATAGMGSGQAFKSFGRLRTRE